MTEDRYRCICHTCGTERLVEGLENAQAFFNEHAERAHEVELLNQQSRQRYPKSDAGADATPENGGSGGRTTGADATDDGGTDDADSTDGA